MRKEVRNGREQSTKPRTTVATRTLYIDTAPFSITPGSISLIVFNTGMDWGWLIVKNCGNKMSIKLDFNLVHIGCTRLKLINKESGHCRKGISNIWRTIWYCSVPTAMSNNDAISSGEFQGSTGDVLLVGLLVEDQLNIFFALNGF